MNDPEERPALRVQHPQERRHRLRVPGDLQQAEKAQHPQGAQVHRPAGQGGEEEGSERHEVDHHHRPQREAEPADDRPAGPDPGVFKRAPDAHHVFGREHIDRYGLERREIPMVSVVKLGNGLQDNHDDVADDQYDQEELDDPAPPAFRLTFLQDQVGMLAQGRVPCFRPGGVEPSARRLHGSVHSHPPVQAAGFSAAFLNPASTAKPWGRGERSTLRVAKGRRGRLRAEGRFGGPCWPPALAWCRGSHDMRELDVARRADGRGPREDFGCRPF